MESLVFSQIPVVAVKLRNVQLVSYTIQLDENEGKQVVHTQGRRKRTGLVRLYGREGFPLR